MQTNPLFHETDARILIERVRENPLAVIIAVNSSGAVHVVHAPVLIETRGGHTFIRFHLARHNPAVLAIEQSGRATCVITGPHAYISPDWYESPNQVGTWNYVSAEASGAVTIMQPENLVKMLDELSDMHETPLLPKPMWTRSKMSSKNFEGLLRAITGFEMQVETLQGTSKLGQNKSPELRARVAKALGADDPIAKAMQGLS